MKLNVPAGPLPLDPPFFDWDEEEVDVLPDEEEIDLTDLFEVPLNGEQAN